MQVNLIGVIENGLVPSMSVPANPRVAIRTVRGSDLLVRLQIYYRSGGVVDLSTGSPALVLTVRKKTTDTQWVISRAGVVADARQGVVTFAILPSDTRGATVTPGTYAYDVWLLQAGVRNAVLPMSPFIIESSVAGIP